MDSNSPHHSLRTTMPFLHQKLIAALLAAGAIGSTCAAEPNNEAGHHHHHFAGDVEAFHSVLAPIWHAPRGQARNRSACRQAGRMAELAQAIHSVDPGKLQASLVGLKDRCRAGKGGIEAALSDVHDEFHHLIEAAS
ncbi:MAG: hypothetical protein E6R10_04585 [Rhodocyclaceae bacterium]|nr:MAG: hypothetical protein E6R10_04585 [Rhodocyclaceae bacterium]